MLLPEIAADETKVFSDFKHTFDLTDKAVLEVGGSIPFALVAELPIRSWVAVDPLNRIAFVKNKYREIQGVAQKIPYSDDSFDFVFSSNALHLISNLDAALKELYRVLKNDGYVYAHYGPIWSAPDGHQLERVEHHGVEYIFWKDHLIPHWYHLIFDRDELTQILLTQLSKGLVDKIVYHIYQGNWVNRMFYEDYLTSFTRSDFTIVSLTSCDTLDYTPSFPNYDHPLVRDSRARNILAAIQQRHGKDKKNIYCRDMRIVLRKIEVEGFPFHDAKQTVLL